MSAFVFATSQVDSHPERYQGWIDYYTEFFRGTDIKLALINDGPTETALVLKDVEQVILTPHLGRVSLKIFPGWKRSFCHGIKMSISRKTSHVAHIESDCFIKPSGKDEFLDHLFKTGYYVPFSNTYRFPETALQIINDKSVIDYFVSRYSYEENLYEEIIFEHMVQDILKPLPILNGDRYECRIERVKKEYDYISGCTTMREFVRLTSS